MDSPINRFNTVALKQTCPLETIDINIKYQLFRFSNVDDDDGRGTRVLLSLKLGDNKLGRLYMPPEFTNVFTLSDMWNNNNDRVKYVVSIVKFDDAHPRNLLLELDER